MGAAPTISDVKGRRVCCFSSTALLVNIYGAPGKDRTFDLRIRNPLLYPLSYKRIKTLGEGLEPS